MSKTFLRSRTEVLADTDASGNVTAMYIMSNGQKVASVRYPLEKNRNKLSEKINFYHNDVLGSVTAITDETGKVVEANIYGPFGETEFSYKATLHKVIPEKRTELLVDPFLYSSDNRYTYTGQEQDEFGGLIYYNARWYDAEIGRFISEDPAAANPNDPLTINQYIYCACVELP
jgi:RHS repeat-associated protein